MKIPTVLSIAGSDSGAGAGVQADLKAMAARGVYATTAITALTAQNTCGVHGVLPIPAEFVGAQIDAVMADIGADAWKTGMLLDADVISVVAAKMRCYQVPHLVVDPVMASTDGTSLLAQAAKDALLQELLPLATVITPNLHEAEALLGHEIEADEGAQREAVAELHVQTGAAIILKGGHAVGEDAVDWLFDGQLFLALRGIRHPTENTHGTGCTFASVLAAELAKGHTLTEAALATKAYISDVIEAADTLGIGSGHGPLNHFLWGE